MFAVWLWIIAINCYPGWKNSCMINTAMSIPFFNALRRTVQYHSEFWHDLASPGLLHQNLPPQKKVDTVQYEKANSLVIWTVWILPAWAATGCSSSPPNLNVHAFTGSAAESGSLEWTSAHQRHRCECFVLAISLTSARSHWHTFFFNLFSAFYKRQVLWTSRKSCKDCKARPDWTDYWSFFFFVFTRFTFEDVLALVPSPDRLAFKATRYSETWSVKPISESKSSARCCAFVVLDNNLMASSSCRDLCVRRVHTWITATCERPQKCDFRQTWLVRSYMKKVISPKGFIRERKNNR